MIVRSRFHRLVLIAAGVYNIAWGLHAVYDPQWLFRFGGLPALNHPQIFACLGMVVGLYGIIYFEVARVPERGWLPAVVGLVGENSWTHRFSFADPERDVAEVNDQSVRHELSYLVDSLLALSA